MIRRRSSYTISSTKGGSASKVKLNYKLGEFVFRTNVIQFQVDLLKSALEINHKSSNPILRKEEKYSDQSLRSIHGESAPKLNNQYSIKNISQPSFIEVLDEVSEFIFT